MVKRFFQDAYGCTAKITELSDGKFRAQSYTRDGRKIRDTTHKNEKAALSALRRDTDGLKEI